MLSNADVSEIARRAVLGQVSDAQIERIVSEPVADSDGNGALRIVLVLTPESIDLWTGDNAVDVLVSIQNMLRDEGEERFPIVQYATEQELLTSEDDDLIDG